MRFEKYPMHNTLYYGVNPYGQFRSIPQYWQVGVVLAVE
jgi:hypothetical protein